MSNYLDHTRGWKSWATSLDHKRISIMYLAVAVAGFVLGGIFAMLIRLELLNPGESFLNVETLGRAYSIHGFAMVFFFLIPGIPAVLGNFMLPIMLGARNMAFPRLNLAGFWLFSVGGLLALITMLTRTVDSGWALYAGFGSGGSANVILISLALVLLSLSSVFMGINIVVSIRQLRPAGMSMFEIPLFLWALFFTAIVQMLTLPVAVNTLILLVAEQGTSTGILDPALFRSLSWAYVYPAALITILAAIGVVSELIPAFSRKAAHAYKSTVFSMAAIAFLTLFSWGQHLFAGGQSAPANAVFSLLNLAIFLPVLVLIYNWLATLYKGSIRFTAPMIFGLMFIVHFAVAGVSALFMASPASSVQLSGTSFETAQLHYALVGGTLIAFLGGLHYWWPKMFGRMYNERLAGLAAILVFVGFNLAFVTQFTMSVSGLLSRFDSLDERYIIPQQLSSTGAFILFFALALLAVNLIRSLINGDAAPGNPWSLESREWSRCPSPPPTENSIEVSSDDPVQLSRPGKLGMWILLAIEGLLFAGLLILFLPLRARHPELFLCDARFMDPAIGALSFLALAGSGLAMALALRNARGGRQSPLLMSVLFSLIFAIAFLGLLSFEFEQRWMDGIADVNAQSVTLVKSEASSSLRPLVSEIDAEADMSGEERSLIAPAALGPQGLSLFSETAPQKTDPDIACALPGMIFILVGTQVLFVLLGIGLSLWILARSYRGHLNAEDFAPVQNVSRYWNLQIVIWIFLFAFIFLTR